MSKNTIPVWLQSGPAEKYYQRHLEQETLRDVWVKMIRERWGNPENPGLWLFPDIKREDKIIPKSIDADVRITQFTPSDPSNDIFVYIHGGGWMIPASGKHLAWAKRISHMTNMTVLSVDYRLLPEHPFPAALNDCITTYLYARQQTSGRVIIGGDSAGGNMGAALALYCYEHHLPLPDKVLCLSSYSDQYFEKYPSMMAFGVGNPYAEMSVIAFMRALYLPNIKDWDNPYASPLYGQLDQMPPTCVLVGLEDPLCDDNITFAHKLKEANAEVKLYTFDRMPHSFFTYPELMPEICEQANNLIVEFMLE
ncbi:MAG TPA: alpha/beta hydrolase [Gammaproteobacteria bacterium]|nr:alpha/beta hydrolase [Gammaproteobacteria bacterium]